MHPKDNTITTPTRLNELIEDAREWLTEEPGDRHATLLRLMGPDVLMDMQTAMVGGMRSAVQRAIASERSESLWAKHAWDEAERAIRGCLEVGLSERDIRHALTPPTTPTVSAKGARIH